MRSVLVWLLISGRAAAAPAWTHVEITATSTKANKADRYAAWRAIDNSTRTAWCKGKPGSGVGEALTIAFAAPTQVPDLSVSSRRVTAVDVTIDGGKPERVALTSAYGYLRIKRAVRSLTVSIAATKKGAGDACLDLGASFLGMYVGDAKAFAALVPTTTAFLDGMKRCDANTLATIGAFPVRGGKRFASAAALAKACSKKQVAKLQGENWEGGHCGLEVPPDRIVCIGMGPDSWWRFAWKSDAWKLVSVTEKYYAE